MDMKKTAREIGLFETAVNLARVKKSTEVIQKVGAAMPLPDEDIRDRIGQIADWLIGFGKNKYMFFMPEIALIEKVGRMAKDNMEMIIAIPCDLEHETKERLINNLPHTIKVTILEEPFFPQLFFPENGMLVISGYLGGDRPMVLPEVYRMVEHYSGFLGKKVFIPYIELDTAMRYEGWMEIGQQRLSTKWRKVS